LRGIGRSGSGIPVAHPLRSVASRVIDRVNDNEPTSFSVLSCREREVLARVAIGQSNKTIAGSLRIALPTVATYLARARRKLGRERARRSLRLLSPFTLDSATLKQFTPAEQAVARLASEGLANRTIAEFLGCSTHTVANHLSRVYAKLGGVNRRALHVVLLEPALPAAMSKRA